MKIVFLGTNGWYTSPTGNTPCILIDSKTHYVIFDAGNGIYKIDEYVNEDKPIVLFISHFHIDHVSGFHTLAKFAFKQGIDVYMAEGRKTDFEKLVNPPYTSGIVYSKINFYKLDTKIRLHELPEGKNDVGFPVETYKLYHAFGDHGYRITLDGKTIVYSGDTKVGSNSYTLAKDADVLIHECAYVEDIDNEWGHVGPGQAAQLAKEANVGKLILTHFDALRYDTLEKRDIAQEKARKVFEKTTAARDDMVFEL